MPIYLIAFMIIILPAFIVLEGLGMFSSFMTRKKWWWNVPHVLIIIFSLLLIYMILTDYSSFRESASSLLAF